MFDQKFVGYELPEFTVQVEAGAVRRFAEALGETEGIYVDENAARAAGYRSVVAMPTFPVVLGTRDELTWGMVRTLGIDPARILHGTQRYAFHDVVCAGDRLRGRKRIVALYQKKALGFIDTVIGYRNDDGVVVVEDFCTFVVRP